MFFFFLDRIDETKEIIIDKSPKTDEDLDVQQPSAVESNRIQVVSARVVSNRNNQPMDQKMIHPGSGRPRAPIRPLLDVQPPTCASPHDIRMHSDVDINRKSSR